MSFEDKLKSGKYWEDKVYEYLTSLGYKVTYYPCDPRTGRQLFTVSEDDGIIFAHPDFTVEMVNKRTLTSRKILVEVKSFGDFYQNYAGLLSASKFPKNKKYAVIEGYKFQDYVQLSNYLQLETRVIFISNKNPYPWYWERLDYLSETSRLATGLFGEDQSNVVHCLWDIDLLRTMNDK